MTRLAWNLVFVMALVVGMFGMLPNAAYAQPQPAAGNGGSTASTAPVATSAWHGEASGFTGEEYGLGWATPILSGPLDGYVELKYSYESFKNLEEVDGREGHHSRQTIAVEGEVDYLLNPNGVTSGDNSVRVGGHFLYENAHGEFSRNVDLLSYMRVGGMFFGDVKSSEGKNHPLMFHAQAAVGAVYLEHGDLSDVQLMVRAEVEVGYRLWQMGRFTIGPVGRFLGEAQVGEHSSAWLDGELSAGLRFAAQDATVDVRGLLIGRDRDSNTVTGNYLKVEQETLHTGVDVSGMFWERLTAGFRITWGRDRIKVNSPSRDYSDDTLGLSLGGSVGWIF